MNTTHAPIANGRYNLGLLRKKEKKMGKKNNIELNNKKEKGN
jgi:hypothetical protein